MVCQINRTALLILGAHAQEGYGTCTNNCVCVCLTAVSLRTKRVLSARKLGPRKMIFTAKNSEHKN